MNKNPTLIIDNEMCYIDMSSVLTSNPPKYQIRKCSDDSHVKYVFCYEVHEMLETRWEHE